MASNVKITTTGFPKMRFKLQETRDAIVAETGFAIYDEFLDVMQRSQDEFVPYLQGDLRDSGYVNEPRFDGEQVTVDMGYGGQGIEYAVRQHEDLTFFHPGGKTAKYLEIPMLEAAPFMPKRMGVKMRRQLHVRLSRD